MARPPRVSILVTFPGDWTDEPELAGTTQVLWFASEEDALLTARGFRMRGAAA